MDQQNGRPASPSRNNQSSARESQKNAATAPYAGKPLDGSQYHDVVEEQVYAEQRPTPEEQRPRRSSEHQDPTTK